MTAITDKKLRDKLMKEKTLELKKNTIELVKQSTYEKKNKKNTIPEALIATKEKQAIKEEPIQKFRETVQDRKTEQQQTDRVDFAGYKTGHQCINAQQPKRTATSAERKDITQKYADRNIPTTEQ